MIPHQDYIWLMVIQLVVPLYFISARLRRIAVALERIASQND